MTDRFTWGILPCLGYSAIPKMWVFSAPPSLGVRPRLATNTAGSGRGPWYLAQAKALSVGLSNACFNSLGLPTLIDGCWRNQLEPPCTDPYARWWQGSAGDRQPCADLTAYPETGLWRAKIVTLRRASCRKATL